MPNEILQRTILIKIGSEAGTAFSIDYQGKIYLITARHVVTGLPATGGTIQIRRADNWADYRTVKTLFPSSSDVDIAILETNEKTTSPFEIKPAEGKEGPTFGQAVWFLGYPFGLGTRLSNMQLPFIKRGTMSAVDATNPDAIVVYIDGFNNPGFSGGPIVFWDFGNHTYRILGVVKGYRSEAAQVLVNGVSTDTNILVNSGILVGYSIKHAVDAIEKDQRPVTNPH
ncbi:MAG TPA: serine protease [Candidatus Acidoferrum sp.]|nr:serine protease [Candidatus Acidoferrum sp.]